MSVTIPVNLLSEDYESIRTLNAMERNAALQSLRYGAQRTEDAILGTEGYVGVCIVPYYISV